MTDPVDLHEGTVTVLCTDLEGSTRLLEAHPGADRQAVASALEEEGGGG
jgi:class 3 adenylate cyclase